MYGDIWLLYYFLMLPIPLTLLFYAFWSGGFFGGPGAKVPQEGPPPERNTFVEKCCGSFQDCCRVCCCCHDWIEYGGAEMCFWSVCLLLQFVVLILFILAIVTTIIAAIQMFLAAGCAQIYLLGDQSICGNVLAAIRMFLETFIPDVVKADFPQHCVDKKLLTCELIGSKMMSSSMMTIAGSFLAATFTFQMLIESGTLHTRALSRIKLEHVWNERHPDEDKAKVVK